MVAASSEEKKVLWGISTSSHLAGEENSDDESMSGASVVAMVVESGTNGVRFREGDRQP